MGCTQTPPGKYNGSIFVTAAMRPYATIAVAHTHPFNGPLSRTARVGRYQKGKTNLDFTEARDSEWQWHQLDQSAPRSRQITMPTRHRSVVAMS